MIHDSEFYITIIAIDQSTPLLVYRRLFNTSVRSERAQQEENMGSLMAGWNSPYLNDAERGNILNYYIASDLDKI